jgi:hypothetical protein
LLLYSSLDFFLSEPHHGWYKVNGTLIIFDSDEFIIANYKSALSHFEDVKLITD